MAPSKVESFRTHSSVSISDLESNKVGLSWQPRDRKPSQDKLFSTGLLVVAALSAFLYIELSACWPQFGRAEVFFAECAREMIEARNWVTPLYHGQGFFDKPILTYWLIIGCFQMFGIDHFVARIPSIIASVTTIVVTALACRRAFGARAALLSAGVLATSFMYLHFSALCMSDSWLVLCDTAALATMYAGLRVTEKRSIYWFFSAVFLALGFLVKGPVALVLPLGFFACYLLATKNLRAVTIRHFLVGTLTVAAIAAPWFLMAFAQCGLDAMLYFFLRENVQRFAAATYDTHRPVWFMLLSLMTGFAPWSVFLPLALAGSISKWIKARAAAESASTTQNAPATTNASVSQNSSLVQSFQSGAGATASKNRAELELFCWLWILVVIGFFSISRGKIDYYALPAFPACAALVGLYLNDWISGEGVTRIDTLGRNFATAAAYLLSIALVVAGVACASLLAELRETSIWSTLGIAFPLALVGVSTFVACRRGMLFSAYATIFSGIILAGTVYALVLMPAIAQMYPVLSYSKIIASASPSIPSAIQGTGAPVSLSISASLPGETANSAGAPEDAGNSSFVAKGTTSSDSALPETPATSGSVGIYKGLDTWVNEVTFSTRREPQVLKTDDQLAAYILSTPGNWLLIWEKDFAQLPSELQGKLKVVDSRKMVQKKIVIGALSNKARIENATKLVLAITR